MEGDLQVKVGVWVDVATLWIDCEVLAVLLRLPLVICLHITKVGQLEALSEPASSHNASKCHDFVHELQLDAVRDTVE